MAAKTASTTSDSSARMMWVTSTWSSFWWAAPGIKTGPPRRPVDGRVSAYPRES